MKKTDYLIVWFFSVIGEEGKVKQIGEKLTMEIKTDGKLWWNHQFLAEAKKRKPFPKRKWAFSTQFWLTIWFKYYGLVLSRVMVFFSNTYR